MMAVRQAWWPYPIRAGIDTHRRVKDLAETPCQLAVVPPTASGQRGEESGERFPVPVTVIRLFEEIPRDASDAIFQYLPDVLPKRRARPRHHDPPAHPIEVDRGSLRELILHAAARRA